MNEKLFDFFKALLDFVKTIILTILAVFIIQKFLFMPVVVDGSSMYPTLEDGQRGFTSLISKRLFGVERFDIVAVYLESKDILLVKRVIGLPGETVELKDDVLYINGEAVEQDFLNEEYMASEKVNEPFNLFTENYGPITLKDDEYFLLGDNRPHSSDSRVFGVFILEDIKSTGMFIYWPLSEIGIKK